jgi:bla regulator protein BlaR1
MIPITLYPALEDLAPALKNHLWQSTIFALVAAMVSLALLKNHARTRYWVWFAASAKFLVPFSLLVGLGGLLTNQPTSLAPPTAVYNAMQAVTLPFSPPEVRIARPLPNPPSSPYWTYAVPMVLASIWVTGFISVLSMWWIYWRRVAKAIGLGIFVSDGRESQALRRLERNSLARAPVRLLLSQSSLGPGIYGFVRPILIWPVGISERIDDLQLESIIAHELCHVRRFDNLAAALHMLVEAVFWFHPLVWWLGSRLEQERERACDQDVLDLHRIPAHLRLGRYRRRLESTHRADSDGLRCKEAHVG